MSRTIAILLALSVLLVAVAVLPASAAEATKAPAMGVQLWPDGEPGQMLVIVSAELPAGQKPPATVDLPLIEGAKVLWAGEILGDDPNNDIQVTPQTVDGKGGKSLRVNLTKGTIAQYEATIPGLTVSGQSVTARIAWVQTAEAEKTSFAVRLPAGVGKVSIRPAAAGEPQTNSAGESLYTLPDRALKPGDDVTVDVAYTKGAAAPIQAPETTSTKDRIPVILGGGALVAAVLAVLLHLRSKGAAEG